MTLGTVVPIPLLEGLVVLEGLELLEGLALADGVRSLFLLLVVGANPADEGRLLFATCRPPMPLGLGPLGLSPPPG